jgi:hypothetical protein
MRAVAHRAPRAFACCDKNRIFYNLNVARNRRAAGERKAPPATRPC